MIKKAILSGANAIVGLRFDRSAQIANATEVLAYGTAVKIKKEEPKAKTLADTGTDVSMMLRTLKVIAFTADQAGARDQGKHDAAALLRWALTSETKTDKAKPKPVQTRVSAARNRQTGTCLTVALRRKYRSGSSRLSWI